MTCFKKKFLPGMEQGLIDGADSEVEHVAARDS